MSYTPPAGDSVEIRFTGGGYTPPAGDAVPLRFGDLSATVTVTASLPLAAAVSAQITLPAVVDATLPLSASVQVSSSQRSAVAGSLPLSASVQAQIPRYVLQGVVKDGDTLVDRRVRVYLRSTGALVAQGDTTAGAFSFDMGDTPAEYMILPVDLAADATDWAPPCANRVLSVLVSN